MAIQPAHNICPLCKESAREQSSGFLRYFECQRCGDFDVDQLSGNTLYYHEQAHRFSGFTREETESDKDPVRLRQKNFNIILQQLPEDDDLETKCLKLLLHVLRKSAHLGAVVNLRGLLDYPITYSRNVDEFEFIVDEVVARGLLRTVGTAAEMGAHSVVLTTAGRNAVSRKSFAESSDAFVAMWFHPKLNSVYLDGIEPAIRDTGYNPIKVDNLHFLTKIDEKIVELIRACRFVVADFTGNRGGVYFEAGLAMAWEKPVIWLCRRSRISRVHFDTRQFNHIAWDTPMDLRRQLVDRIRNTIGGR
ncbi:MAG: hypothetical protein JNK76_15800 [Planctomycetales bacterium]|nr:hypothetical protein [Planctomycetales bacterium]MBN8628619.1 hypothetical protein [Planctomycetota bacterium]